MAWFRVDDHLYSHPKWLALSKGARAHVIADDALVIDLHVAQRWCLYGEDPGAVITVRGVR